MTAGCRAAFLIAALALAPIAGAHGQGGTHLLIVTGLSGEPRYAREFAESASRLVDAARSRWGVADSSLIYLAEDPAADRARISGRATSAEIAVALSQLATRSAPGDIVFVALLGHGSGEGAASRIGLPGPDLSVRDLAELLAPLEGRTLVVLNAASGSGDFLPALSGKGRVVITATKSAMERNATTFAVPFTKGLVDGEADADKDGRVTLLEAFQYARGEVTRAYESDGRLLTEHAQLDDNGDQKGSAEPGSSQPDGTLARQIAFGLRPVVVSSDPRVAALEKERRALESAVAELRLKKVTMDSVSYERELERLVTALAEKTRELRELEAQKP
jgi:hypothetical protein